MACNDCPEITPNPNEGCLHTYLSSCITYDGDDITCADISEGQTLNQVIEQLAENDCNLKEEIEDINQDITNLQISLTELSGNVNINLDEINNHITEIDEHLVDIDEQLSAINSFSCEDLNSCSFDDLGDVEVSPVSGDGLVFNGDKWVNYPIQNYEFTCEELSGCSLDELSGVVITDPASGDVIYHNGTVFSNYPLSSLINVSASNGLTELNGNVKLGGTLTENTEIDFDNSFNLSFNNLGKLSILSGGQSEDDNSIFQSSHSVTNQTPTLGYIGHVCGLESNLSSYTLTNGKPIINEVNTHTFIIGSNLTTSQLQNGSQISNGLDYIRFDATGADRTIAIEQEEPPSTIVRVFANRKIITEISPLQTNYKVTVNKFANLELSTNINLPIKKNVFTNFYQLLIKQVEGNVGNNYGIYQEGDDPNVFYGDINYHGLLHNASDIRSKNKGEAFTKGLAIIEQINPVFFTKKEGFGVTNVNHVGIIAQEVEGILPESIKIGKCQDIEDFRFYDQSVLLYTLVNAVKELSQKIKQLENAQ